MSFEVKTPLNKKKIILQLTFNPGLTLTGFEQPGPVPFQSRTSGRPVMGCGAMIEGRSS